MEAIEGKIALHVRRREELHEVVEENHYGDVWVDRDYDEYMGPHPYSFNDCIDDVWDISAHETGESQHKWWQPEHGFIHLNMDGMDEFHEWWKAARAKRRGEPAPKRWSGWTHDEARDGTPQFTDDGDAYFKPSTKTWWSPEAEAENKTIDRVNDALRAMKMRHEKRDAQYLEALRSAQDNG